MRRLTKIAAASAVLALTLTGCGNGNEETPETGAGEDICADASGDGPKIGLAYDVGGRGDQS